MIIVIVLIVTLLILCKHFEKYFKDEDVKRKEEIATICRVKLHDGNIYEFPQPVGIGVGTFDTPIKVKRVEDD